MSATATPDVVVVGGGIIGLATAWRTAQRGLRVTVVDPALRSGASHVAAGMLAPVTEVHYGEDSLLALDLASAERWPAFAAELEEASGRPTGFRADGTVMVAYDGDDRAALDHLAAYQQRLGLTVQRLRSREARALEPMVSPAIRGGVVARGDHRVDPRAVTAALVEAGRRAGVTFVEWAAAAVEDGAVVLADGERLATDRVVVAAGCASPHLVDVPVRPVKGQVIVLRGSAEEPILTRAVRGLVKGSSVYLVPRDDGRIVVGATVEEKEWDTTVTAGGVYELLRDATLIVPGISELELVETIAGLRPGTPDNAPIIGLAPAHGDRVVVATGHYRSGILLTPVTADTVAELVATGVTPKVIAPFAPERFT